MLGALGKRLVAYVVLLAVAMFVGALIGGPTARASVSEVIASESRSTGLSAYGGVLVWSSYKAEQGRYRLTVMRQGRVVRVPMPSRRVPFDADVGRDARGEPQIVYSRCAREPRAVTFGPPNYASGRGCRLWRYSFRNDSERRIRGAAVGNRSAFRPSLWGSRLVYGMTRRRGDAGSPQFRMLSLRSGKRRAISVRSRFAEKAAAGTTVTGLDLSGTRFTVGLDHADVKCGPPPGEGDKVGTQTSELFAGPLTSLRRILTTCPGDLRSAVAPSWHRGDVFAVVQRSEPEGIAVRRRQLSPEGRTVAEVDVPPDTEATATDETGHYLVVFRSATQDGKRANSFDVEKVAPPP